MTGRVAIAFVTLVVLGLAIGVSITRDGVRAAEDAPRRDRELERPDLPIRRGASEPGPSATPPTPAPLAYTDASGRWERRGPNACPPHPLHAHPSRIDSAVLDFARTGERVRLVDLDRGDVYLFERNPLHPLRGAMATFLPSERRIVDLTWPEVLDLGHGPTWNEIAGLGVEDPTRAGLRPTDRVERAFGLEFRVHRGEGVEVAWNAQHGLPLRLVRETPRGTEQARLTALELGAPADGLPSAEALHPDWQRIDLADWREEHRDGGAASSGH